MFKVLSAPFGANVQYVAPNASSALAWTSKKGTRVLVSSVETNKVECESINFRFETIAECLNAPPSLEFVKEMLRSIVYTWQMDDEYRRKALRPMPLQRRPPFAPDNDYGHGGSGFDGYW